MRPPAIDVAAELARITYKPGWEFKLEPAMMFGEQTLVVRAKVQDVYHQDRESVVFSRHTVPPYLQDREHFDHWLAQVVLGLERHEMQEWLHRDGVAINDPHAGATR